MVTRWDVERAVLHSQLDPPARLLVLALLTKANNDTAVIPPEHSPSLTTIQGMTGLSRSAVAEWLDALEIAGWVKRIRPSRPNRGDRTQYALTVGESVAQKRPRPSRKRATAVGASEGSTEVVRTTDHQTPENDQFGSPHHGLGEGVPSPHHGLALVRQADHPSPHHGPATTKSSPTESSTHQHPPSVVEAATPDGLFQLPDPPPPDSNEKPVDNAGTILAAFLDYCTEHGVKIPKQIRGQYAKRIKEALDDEFTARQVKQALAAMFDERVTSRPSLLPNKLVELQTGPERPRRYRPAAVTALPSEEDLVREWKGLRS